MVNTAEIVKDLVCTEKNNASQHGKTTFLMMEMSDE